LAMVLSVAMMLRYSLDMPVEATWIERAVARVLADGYRTGDIHREGEGKKVGTTEMGDRVRDAVQKTSMER